MVFAKRTGLCGVLAVGHSVNRQIINKRMMHTRQQEHLSLLNTDVPEFAIVDDPQEHAALVLVEPFLQPTKAPSALCMFIATYIDSPEIVCPCDS